MAEPFVVREHALFGPISAAADRDAKMAIYATPTSARRCARSWPRRAAVRSAAAGSARSCRGSRPTRRSRSATCAELAAERGVDPTDLVLDLALETDLEARFRMAVLNYDEDEVEELLTDPHTMLGLSDAGAHASQLCDACFSTHLLVAVGARAQGAHARGGGAQAHDRAGRGVRPHRPGPARRGRPADVVVFDAAHGRRLAAPPGARPARRRRSARSPTPSASTPWSSTASSSAATTSTLAPSPAASSAADPPRNRPTELGPESRAGARLSGLQFADKLRGYPCSSRCSARTCGRTRGCSRSSSLSRRCRRRPRCSLPDAQRPHHRQGRAARRPRLHPLRRARSMLRRHARPGRVRGRRRVLRRQGRDGLRPRPAGQPLPPGHRLLRPRGRRVRRAVADHPHHQRRAAGADARRDDRARWRSARRSRWSSAS